MRGILRRADGFCDLLDSWVRGAAEAGVRSFEELLRRLPGAYPVDVAASVHRLWCAGSVPRSLVARLLPRAEGPRQMVLPPPSLPRPHPLDYDWRFTTGTSEFLWQQAVRFGRPHEPVICLGTPSVFQTALRRAGSRRAVLVDGNTTVVRHFMRESAWHRVLRCDVLADDLPPLRAPAIVADPPWYEDHMAAFVWAASQMSVAGGHVLMGLPPRGTRPGVADDVGRVLDLACGLGFEVILTEEGVLAYDSPPFERNALRAAGIFLADYTWRRGDLYLLRRRTVTAQGRPAVGERPA